jgi:uncharacterized protein YijF (DUF1287 family)
MYGDSYLSNIAKNKFDKINTLIQNAHKKAALYKNLSKEKIRTEYYNNGVSVKYITHTKDGRIKKVETIHYKMLFRSTGKAKKGSCMFIRDKLYQKAIDFLYMGIKLPKKNPMIVEIGAYAPLVASGIVGKIKINPKNILILKDIDKYFSTNVISVETDENKHCIAKRIDNYQLKNTLFDGQALIDSSIFPKNCNGYILLRHHFCKMAAFNSNIQLFFKEYFGEDYDTAIVTDMFGNKHYAKDIELITTDNAVKWLKFGVSYDTWCEKVAENGCMFGIVKTAHPSKLGNKQKMSYQMVNSMDSNSMESIVKDSVDYITALKTDDNTFLSYLQNNKNFSNDYEVLLALCEHNVDFVQSTYFRERKKKIIEAYILKTKNGEILQEAENLTIVGSPYAMLLYAASGNMESVDKDDTFKQEAGVIQCYTERFEDKEFLAGFRSPFNSKNNLIYLHNVYSNKMTKYFNLGRQIIAINMIGTDFQDRANGADMDSDFLYTTNTPAIVEHAKECYKNYLTIVNNIPKEKNTYTLSMNAYADIDNNLAKSQTNIGESSNLAQIAQTYAYNFDKDKYDDYVCILSVIAQVAIDNAKRRFDIDISQEIARIKKDMDVATHKYPKFWKIIKREFNGNNINYKLHCPMNYLANLDLYKYRSKNKTIPVTEFFSNVTTQSNRKQCKKVEELIERYSLQLFRSKILNEHIDCEQYLLLRSDFDKLIADIRSVYISKNYVDLMQWLINRAFITEQNTDLRSHHAISKLNKNKPLLLKTLYEVNPTAFLECFTEKKSQKMLLFEDVK